MNKEASLQDRYTSLLETRITQLEAVIEISVKRLHEAAADEDRLSTITDKKDDRKDDEKDDKKDDERSKAEQDKTKKSSPNAEV